MLKAAALPETDQIFYHGFINSGGHKMSKSLGNVISPYEMVERYGTDATRYILLRHVHPAEDSDLTWEKMDGYYTDNLVNGLGNLVARVMNMSEKNEVGTMLETEAPSEEIDQAMNDFAFHEALGYIWSRIQKVDQTITEEEPFKVVKTDLAAGKAMIQKYVSELNLIAIMLEPYMPETARIIKEAILSNKKPENLFLRLED